VLRGQGALTVGGDTRGRVAVAQVQARTFDKVAPYCKNVPGYKGTWWMGYDGQVPGPTIHLAPYAPRPTSTPLSCKPQCFYPCRFCTRRYLCLPLWHQRQATLCVLKDRVPSCLASAAMLLLLCCTASFPACQFCDRGSVLCRHSSGLGSCSAASGEGPSSITAVHVRCMTSAGCCAGHLETIMPQTHCQ
jgi:hypothetical protein